jgi:hypothetical protein
MSMALMLAASAQFFACPGEINDKQVVAPQASWEVRTDAFPRPLDNVLVFSGHPSKRTSMMGQRLKSGHVKWAFNDKNVWVECRYSRSSAVLTKRISGANTCTFTPQEADKPASIVCDHKK